jgi:hypothetical protein
MNIKTAFLIAIILAISSQVLPLTLSQARAAASTAPEPKFASGVTPEKVTPAKFKSEYAWVGKTQTMHEVTYLGQRNGRVYIKRNSMSLFRRKWTAHIIYVELSELDPSFRNSLPKTEFKDAK